LSRLYSYPALPSFPTRRSSDLTNDVTLSLGTYFKQCSIMVTCQSLANLGAVLANDGIAPWNNERIISSEAATYTKSVMMTTGLRSEEHTSELQSRFDLVCRLLL